MATKDSKGSDKATIMRGISPSAFMRELRPEVYSDTMGRTTFHLAALALEYHLESITSRNQTHDFEVFCRKLCERAICPNLRPQTGPEGGGDSKADTETYPVAEEIAGLTYVGDANSGSEKWAFAFSAKKTWADKVRNDVKGIVESGRSYDRIICVTSRFARAKVRARVEDELSKKYGLPVTIHDRSWIVEEVIAHDRADLAFNYLKIGESVANDTRLGPTDYSRKQQLEDAERAIQNPDAFRGMERQRATEALVAAKLSRGLERSRIETDGRFVRAIRFADADGTYRQQLEARYEQIWTAFWWHDDFEFLNASYDDFQSRALQSDHAKNLEFLGNLNQLLVNSVIHGHMTRGECRLDERTRALRQALEAVAGNIERPNNSLEAETALLRIKLNQATLAQDRNALSDIWNAFGAILKKAAGLGEYDADALVRFIEIGGQIAGNDPAYNELVEKLAIFVGSRKSEGEGAAILLKRAQKLDFHDHFDMIRWLGKAAVGLTKREYAEQLIEALQLLTLAYRSAGLPWASRATCAFAAASIAIKGEADSELSVGIVPTMKVWAWDALELSHLPDFLFAVQMLNGFMAGLPLDDESKERTRDDINELDAALGCLLLNVSEDDLRRLESVPDILEALGLFTARAALLYALGHIEQLREDGSLPKEETDEEVKRVLSLLKSQPVGQCFRSPVVLNEVGRQVVSTTILGMRVEVEIDCSASVLVAESILGCLEAFFATAIAEPVAPHTELFRIIVSQNDEVKEPVIETNELDMTSTVAWPRGLSVGRNDQQRGMWQFFAKVAAHVMGAACMVSDAEALIERLCADGALQHRIVMILIAPNCYSRIAMRGHSSLSDWSNVVRQSYPLRDDRVILPRVTLSKNTDSVEKKVPAADPISIHSHRDMSVSSVIDVHAWEKARWRGCGYLQMRLDYPPCLALVYENAEAGRKIFERWRARFGEQDVNEEIAVSVIRNLPETNPHHYLVQVSSRLPKATEDLPNLLRVMTTRSNMMEPANSKNLEWFLAGFRHFRAFFMIPAIGLGKDEIFLDHAILKRSLSVKSADEVKEQDIESLALRQRGLKFAS